jgi:hypothetical protein
MIAEIFCHSGVNMRRSNHRESGFSTLGLVIIVAGIAGVVGGYNVLRSQSVLKASDVRNASQEAGDLNYNAFSVYQALASGANPAIYPDPYLPISNARMVVNPNAVPNDLWKGTTDTVTIFSTSYHGNPKGRKAATDIKSVGLEAQNSARPYLITHADVKAGTSVTMALAKSNKNVNSTATVKLAPPPTPQCKIGFTGTPSTQPFTCVKTPAKKVEVIDPKTGEPELDPATGEPKMVEKPATYQDCPGMTRNWAFDTDVGQDVTAHFFGSGVVVDASVRQAPALEGPLNFPTGNLPKNNGSIPYPGAHRVAAVDASLRDITFRAMNSQWIELSVVGPDGSVGKCVAGLHVNRGPELNTPTDSWAADTLVQLEDGSYKKISKLAYGDRVWNPRYKEAASVLHVHETAPPSPLVEIKLGSKSIHVTSQHPFISRRGFVFARDLRPGDQLPGVDEPWKTVVATRIYRPEPGSKVYDVFLDSKRAPAERLLNMDGLLTPSYEWQSELGALPNLTIFDMPNLPELW